MKRPTLNPIETVSHPTQGDIGTICYAAGRRDCTAYICNKFAERGQVYHTIYEMGFGLSDRLWDDYFDEYDVELVFMRHMETGDIYEYELEQFREDGEFRHDRGTDAQWVLPHDSAKYVWNGLGQNIWRSLTDV